MSGERLFCFRRSGRYAQSIYVQASSAAGAKARLRDGLIDMYGDVLYEQTSVNRDASGDEAVPQTRHGTSEPDPENRTNKDQPQQDKTL